MHSQAAIDTGRCTAWCGSVARDCKNKEDRAAASKALLAFCMRSRVGRCLGTNIAANSPQGQQWEWNQVLTTNLPDSDGLSDLQRGFANEFLKTGSGPKPLRGRDINGLTKPPMSFSKPYNQNRADLS